MVEAIIILFVIGIIIGVWAKILNPWLQQRHEDKKLQQQAAEKRRHDDLIVAQVRQKQQSGVISTGLMMRVVDATGELTGEASIGKSFTELQERYSDNGRALASEMSRWLQSVLQTTLVVPNEQDLATCMPLTVRELVRHMLGTWSISPAIFVGRFVHEVTSSGSIIPEKRVELSAELIFEAAQMNELIDDPKSSTGQRMRVPLQGRLMDRQVHAARLLQQAKDHTAAAQNTPQDLSVVNPAPAARSTAIGKMVAVRSDLPSSSGLELDTSDSKGEDDWRGKLASEFTQN